MDKNTWHDYKVKNMADRGEPQIVKATSKRKAAQVFVGRYTDESWTIGVWTEKE